MERYGVQTVFVLLVIILAAVHRVTGWQLIFDNVNPWHTKSRGLSHLARFLNVREDLIQRYIEPLLCVVIGFILMAMHLTYLGIWIVFAGFTLAAMEQLVLEQAMNDLLDRHDARVEAKEIKVEDTIIQQGGTTETLKMADTGGIRVSVSPEIQKLLLREEY